jgi:FlgD Ig-like domain
VLRRLAPLAVVLALLGATAAAFGITERLKLERAPISAPDITPIFSPVCECDQATATIAFRLREAGRVSVSVVDADGDVVRDLVNRERAPAGGRVETTWDGRNDDGAIVPEGVYRPRLRLTRDRRELILPNPIRVDTTAPKITLVSAEPEFFSPDGDGRNDRVEVRYRLTEKANAMLLVNGIRRVRTRFRPTDGVLTWYGKVAGRSQRAGLYRLQLSAEDPAGNLATRTRPAFVEISYVTLGRETIRAKVRTRFGVRVTTDAARFTWRFAGGKGQARPGLLVLRAPRKAGSYRLFVEANGHAAKARVVVTPRPRIRRSGS